MHVVIDARELCGRPTGVGRYLSGLLDHWTASARARRHEWTLVTHAPIAIRQDWAAVRVVPGRGGTAWEQWSLPRTLSSAKPDVFFAPGYTAPLTVAAPLVLTIHDVSFCAHPEWFSFREGARRRWLTAWSARRARKVITDSQFSRNEVSRYIGLGADRIEVIPLGLHRSNDRLSDRSNDRPMILYVGTILARRRVDRLIASFDDVVARVPEARLEIVGENRTPGLDLDLLRRRSAHADRITIRSYVDEATLADLYRRASVFAFLSEYEGFGFTPLEALSHGVPPVVLDTPIARETCGEAARYVAADATTAAVAASIADVLSRAAARGTILSHGAAVLGRYDWERAADQTLSVLEEAARG